MGNGETISKTDSTVEKMNFTKQQILEAKKYANRKDLVGALLEEGETYSLSEVDAAISDFMKRKVK